MEQLQKALLAVGHFLTSAWHFLTSAWHWSVSLPDSYCAIFILLVLFIVIKVRSELMRVLLCFPALIVFLQHFVLHIHK